MKGVEPPCNTSSRAGLYLDRVELQGKVMKGKIITAGLQENKFLTIFVVPFQ